MPTRNFSPFAAPVTVLDAGRMWPRVGPPRRRLDLSGPVLGARYRLLHRLGHTGAMTMHAAEDLDSGQRVVIRLLPEPQYGAMALRYLAETRVARSLYHPNIVETLDFGCDIIGDGEPVAYLVMEHLQGENLAATLDLDGPLGWTQALMIARQVCMALIAAHECGIVHCNITPSNCFLVPRDQRPALIKMLGFGGASFAYGRAGRCTPDPRPGAPGSIAPELLAGEPFDGRVDVYAVGLLIYRLTTDRMPYAPPYAAAGEPVADASAPGSTDPLPMREALPSLEVPAAFEAVVRRALARDPEQRLPSAWALYNALVAVELAASRRPRRACEPHDG